MSESRSRKKILLNLSVAHPDECKDSQSQRTNSPDQDILFSEWWGFEDWTFNLHRPGLWSIKPSQNAKTHTLSRSYSLSHLKCRFQKLLSLKLAGLFSLKHGKRHVQALASSFRQSFCHPSSASGLLTDFSTTFFYYCGSFKSRTCKNQHSRFENKKFAFFVLYNLPTLLINFICFKKNQNLQQEEFPGLGRI